MPDAKLPSLAEEDADDAADATRVGAGTPFASEAAAPLKGYLTVVVGVSPGMLFPLNAPSLTIGRGNECDIRLESESISRKHARIARQAGNYMIEDLGSTNGTWVDGTPAGPEPLQSGARIRIGNEVIVRFSMLDDTEAALQQRLYEGVVQDTVTGAYNRRHFDRSLASEVVQAQKFNIPLALMVIEIADMKGITDYYTQAGGDALMRAVAKLIQESVHAEDLVARIASDRFAIIAHGMASEDVAALATKLPAAIERLEVVLQSGDFSMCIEQVKSFAGVIDVSDLPDPNVPESLLAAAIERLQTAKKDSD